MSAPDGSPQSLPPSVRLALVWLVLVFAFGLGLRLTPRDQGPELGAKMKLGERLALLAEKSASTSDSSSYSLREVALSQETDPLRQRVIEGGSIPTAQLETLPEGYQLLAARPRSPEQQRRLEELTQQAQERLVLCLSLVLSLAGGALLLALFAPSAGGVPVSPPSSLPPWAVLAVFLAWDTLQVFGIGLLVEWSGARRALPPLATVLLTQAAGYLLFFALLRRRALVPVARSNLTLSFPAAWLGRGYLGCYALVITGNLVLQRLSGRPPTSSNPLLEMFLEAPLWQVAVLTLLVVGIGPAFEELVFRGWLLGGLRAKWGDRTALLVSAGLFALVHGDLWATPALFVLGLVFGGVYLRTGSLTASILLHSLWNGTTCLLLFASMP